VIAKILTELKRLDNPETPSVLSVLVIEDLAMAVYLPLTAVLLTGGSVEQISLSVAGAITAVMLVLFIAVRYGQSISRFVAHESDEIILLSCFGAVLLVAGLAQRLQVSAAIGAFLVGIAASGSVAEQSHRLFAPLRDLFAATFFFFFGMQIDPATLPTVLPAAITLGIVTAATKILTGYFASSRSAGDRHGRMRAGMALVARGEFSMIIAGLGAAVEPRLEPFSAAYVLFLVILGPLLTRAVK
jgi:CPA2 family monovalent cation:H+ antiporter-2